MSSFVLSLSHLPADSTWGEKAIVSFTQHGACVHLAADQQALRTIQKAARKLSSLISHNIKFTDDWTADQQWAFVTSFCGVGFSGNITWSKDAEVLAQRYQALAFTRHMINDTPEQMSPQVLAQQAADWLSSLAPNKVSYKMIVGEELREQGWMGIYEVGRGSSRPPVMLELDYNPSEQIDTQISTALVGKGITFDSGGYSIKSSEGMLDMKCDMGGAATVTGALGLAILQGLQKRVKLYLCCAENLISDHAYKLGDIIRYKNGVTVEIVNTDAEGRLVLADGLMAAQESGADKIIDAATLTGAAVMAVGREFNAVFSKDESACADLMQSAAKYQEPHWRLPLMEWHQEQCPSPFADTANSRPLKGGGAGGASNAAGFLSRFVEPDGKGWIHLDLAAAYNRNGTDTMPQGASGMGILTIADQLM